MRAFAIVAALSAVAVTATAEVGPQISQVVPLAPTTTYGGYTLTTGIGSGAFHPESLLLGLVYTCTDRGPNADFNGGKQYPLPGFAPKIYALWLSGRRYDILGSLTLRDTFFQPLNGLPNPLTPPKQTELAFDAAGAPLAPSVSGVDTEGLVQVGDGTFWLADENAPSLLHIDWFGRVVGRFVPKTVETDLASAPYPVFATLPQIFRQRRVNRGFEAIALAKDGRTVYTALQSTLDWPLTVPKGQPKPRDSRTIRFLAIDTPSGAPKAEWVYQMDPYAGYTGAEKQGDMKISELVMLDRNRLLVEERTDLSIKLFIVDLRRPATNILGSRWDEEATSPSLEQRDLAAEGVVPLTKTKIFDQDLEHAALPGKIEGIAQVLPGVLALFNDNDFNIAGTATSTVTWLFLPPTSAY